MSMIGFKAKNHPQQTAKGGALDEVDDRGTKWDFIHALEDRFGGKFTLDVAAAPHNAKAERYFTRADNGLLQPWSSAEGPEQPRVWCNPPYSRQKGVMDLGSWVRKAWDEWNQPDLSIGWCSTCDAVATSMLNGSVLGAEPKREGGNWGPGASFAAKSHRIKTRREGAEHEVTVRSIRPSLIAMLVPANRVEQTWWQDLVEPYRDQSESPLRVEFQRGRMRFDMPPDWVMPEKGDRPPFGLALLIWSGNRRLTIPPATTAGGRDE